MQFHFIYIDSCGTLQGKKISCLKCTISARCDDCDNIPYFDYDNLINEFEDDDDDEEIDIDGAEPIDEEDMQEEFVESIDNIQKSFVGWVYYGGNIILARLSPRI